jgi:signal transduction histidine kinase
MNRSASGYWLTSDKITGIGITVLGLLFITFLHYSTAPGFASLHAVYRYFYFLPIVFAALRFGFWGGLLAALAASLLFAPHIVFKWGNFPEDSINDLLVVIVFVSVAIITGVTVDRLRAAQVAQRQTAEELAASLEKLEEQGKDLRRAERLSALGTLSGGLAHQIRNPVGIIRASAQLLAGEGSPEVRETGRVIEEESDRIEHLIQDLLRYADVTQLQIVTTDPAALIEQVAGRARPLAEAANIRLETEHQEALPAIDVDPGQVEQALLNLIVNAIQSVGQDGKVVLSAKLSSDRNSVEIGVIDDGPGIDGSEMQRIFDPFFSTKDNGTGLGLSVVHRIAEDHGARIFVSSRPGGGTTFTLRFPCAAT